MSELTFHTYDWVPKGPRGFVRDPRLRWAGEEAGLSYIVQTVLFEGRETNHLDRQHFETLLPHDRPASEAYVARVTERPAFKKAHADQLAHIAAADAIHA